MVEEELEELRRELRDTKTRMDTLEREIRLLNDPDLSPEDNGPILEFQGDFFQMIAMLRELYLDQEEDRAEIRRISQGIEQGKVKVDMTDLFFRFFVRQEIQNARMKLLFLSQRFEVEPHLFDQLDDLSLLIEDPRYSVQQVIIGWKRFERDVSTEIKRLQTERQ